MRWITPGKTGHRFPTIAVIISLSGLFCFPCLYAFQDKTGRDKRYTLLEIAQLEGALEKKSRDKMIREAIIRLGVYNDPSLSYFRRKQAELIALGKHSIPHLIEAMENRSDERTVINAGRISAGILAHINDPQVEKEALRLLLESDHDRTRAWAISCLGLSGITKHLDLIEPNIESKNEILAAETLIALGRLKSENTIKYAINLLAEDSSFLKVSAIEALNLLGLDVKQACESVMSAFESTENRNVQSKALEFLMKHSGLNCCPGLIRKYNQQGIKFRIRNQILLTITEIAKRLPKDQRAIIIDFLTELLDHADFETVKKAAFRLNDLDEDRGLAIITENLDILINTHGKGEYYFRRGYIFLRFRKYSDAKHDFMNGIKKDKEGGLYGKEKIFTALARCFAAEGRFPESERYIRRLPVEKRPNLPYEYTEFRKMADNEHYGKVFLSVTK